MNGFNKNSIFDEFAKGLLKTDNTALTVSNINILPEEKPVFLFIE